MIAWRFQRSRSHRGFAVALAIAMAGIALEVYQWAAVRPLWLDEEMIALNVRDRAIDALAGQLWLGQSAPLGWLALQRLAILIAGPSDGALRFLPLAFGVGALITAVGIGRRWMGPVGAAMLALLCAFGQWLSFYALELKPYSADVFFALLLPALAVWSVDLVDSPPRGGLRRLAIFWIVAAAAHWFAHGALLVTPACAAAIVLVVWRQQGWREAARSALPGFLWLASSGLNYFVSLRHTLASEYLKEYWAFALPPASAGVAGTFSWLAAQIAPFAVKPGGAALWIPFWIAVAGGIALLLRDRFALGLVAALIPLSAFSLAALRLAPLYERLSLWVVPAAYIAIAASADAGVALVRDAWKRRQAAALPLAGALAGIALLGCADILQRGVWDMRMNRPRATNHGLDDREAVRWLMAQRRPTDDLMTTRNGLPAVWWYGGIPISGPYAGGGQQGEEGRVFEVWHRWPGPDCSPDILKDALRTRSRVLLYLGFRAGDFPDGFDEMLLNDLARIGVVIAERRFGDGLATIVDLTVPPSIYGDTQSAPRKGTSAIPEGCVVAASAQRW